MELTPGRQARFPNSVQDCWDALSSGLRCLTGFDGKGNGYCHTHAKDALRNAVESVDFERAMEAEATRYKR